MITIDLSLAVALYLTISAMGILVVWVYFNRNKFKKYSSDDYYVWRCAICAHTYVDSVHKYISECPRCGTLNRREATRGSVK